MNEKPHWELVDEDAGTNQRFGRQQFSQKAFLFSLLGKYPRLKLAGMAAVGVLLVTLLALFSLVVVTTVTLASALMLLTAWLRTKFFSGKKSFAVNIAGK
ncbi:MAG: hypothetical protein ACO1NO_14540 [Burkholderiaceae bacterium]